MVDAARSASTSTSGDQRAEELVRWSPLPLVLLRLPDGRTLEVSDAFTDFIGRSRADCLTMDVSDYSDDPDGARASFALIAAGTLDSYTRHVRFVRPGAEPAPSGVHVTAWGDDGPRRCALGTILPEYAFPLEFGHDGRDALPGIVVIGTLDEQWRIDRITSDGEGVFLHSPEDLLGTSALAGVHAEDVGLLLMLAAHSAARAGRATARVRVRSRSGGWLLARITLQPLAGRGGAAYAFSLCVDGGDSPPEPQGAPTLEGVLERTQRDVRAAGLAAWLTALPSALQLRELSSLTTREYEILLRLASGHRVASIATELYLSQSTIRNHLTAIFRKFGVRSQTELLDRLRPSPGTVGDDSPT